MTNEMPGQWQGEHDCSDLQENNIPDSPIPLFSQWMEQAQTSELKEPTAMTLATVDPDGSPSARMVLLKGFDETGFRFYSNYLSRKGAALAVHARAALVFWWEPLERQVRITGPVIKVSAQLSDTYYARRSRGSQIGAHASQQSQVISGRQELIQRTERFTQKFAQGEVPRPNHWGGYQVNAQTIEFWQARRSRLHDRLRYKRSQGRWLVERLAP